MRQFPRGHILPLPAFFHLVPRLGTVIHEQESINVESAFFDPNAAIPPPIGRPVCRGDAGAMA